MQKLFPEKLRPGDEIRVISPAQSITPFMTEEVKSAAKSNLESIGLHLSFGKHVDEADPLLQSAPIDARVEDLHEAFSDREVKGILTLIGGFNSNELLPYLDYSLIRSYPKILCGYSDITILENAIYAKTGLVTYSGPHWFDFGWNRETQYITEYFKDCLFESGPFEVKPSREWSFWSYDNGKAQNNEGQYVINEGECSGTIVGGNLVTFLHLAGTEFMPSLKDTVLFIEDDHLQNLHTFNGEFTALTQLSDFDEVRGMVLGRFNPGSKISKEALRELVRRNKRLDFPIIADVDFGHTTSKITFPIGGTARITADDQQAKVEILEH